MTDESVVAAAKQMGVVIVAPGHPQKFKTYPAETAWQAGSRECQ